MPEMLYDVIRCTAVHEASLPKNLRFTKQSIIQTGFDGELVLPIDVIYGLLIAIITSPKNSDEQVDEDPLFWFRGKSIRINELWGERDKIETFLGIE
jgi:hypothetical protein